MAAVHRVRVARGSTRDRQAGGRGSVGYTDRPSSNMAFKVELNNGYSHSLGMRGSIFILKNAGVSPLLHSTSKAMLRMLGRVRH